MKPTVLIATWSDGLFAVTSQGTTQEIANQSVRGLAADGRGGALAIVDRHSLCRRAPSGLWAPIATSEVELSCCVAVGDAIYVGTDDARMLRLSDGGGVFEVLAGFDTVAGREHWFAGSAIVDGQRVGPPLGIRSVAANASGSVLCANVHVGGIPRSTDGGRTWHPTIDIGTDVHEVCAHPDNPDLVAAASGVGLCVSRDAGATWAIESDGLHAPHCSAVTFWGDEVLVSAATDPFAAAGRLYRRPLKVGGTIAAVENGLPTWTDGKIDTGCLASDGAMVATVDRGGTLYLCTGEEMTWSESSSRFPAPSGVLLC